MMPGLPRLSVLALGCALLVCLLLWHLWRDADRRADEAERAAALSRQESAATRAAVDLRDHLHAAAQRQEEDTRHALEHLAQDDGLPAALRWDELDRLLRTVSPGASPATGQPDAGRPAPAVPGAGL